MIDKTYFKRLIPLTDSIRLSKELEGMCIPPCDRCVFENVKTTEEPCHNCSGLTDTSNCYFTPTDYDELLEEVAPTAAVERSDEEGEWGGDDAGKHYRFEYDVAVFQKDLENGSLTVKLDPFRIADIYGMSDFALMTILKKTLCAGNRGYKDLRQDLEDIICAAKRRIEMLDEDDA